MHRCICYEMRRLPKHTDDSIAPHASHIVGHPPAPGPDSLHLSAFPFFHNPPPVLCCHCGLSRTLRGGATRVRLLASPRGPAEGSAANHQRLG